MAMSYTDTVVLQASEASHLITSSPHQPAYHECVHTNVSLVHHTTLVHPSFRLACHNTPVSSPIPSRPMSCRSSSPLPSARLPDEIFAQIAQYVLGNAFDGLDVSKPSADCRKPAFSDIDGMTRASRRLRAISLPEWFRLFIVSDTNDWKLASRLDGMYTWVRHIICPADALDLSPAGSRSPTPMDVLARFPYLRSASLALSRDYHFNLTPPSYLGGIYPSAPSTCEIVTGFEYCFPVSSFPPTMTSISVRGTHGSETPLLRNLSAQCPDLRVLRLAKCTMFDSCTKAGGAQCSEQPPGDRYCQIADGTGCAYWGTFPFDHDIYFGSENTEAYADELAAELAPLQNLEEISVGVYLTPIGALAEHRLAHYPLRHLRDDDPLVHNMITAAAPNPSQPPIFLPEPSTMIEQPYQPAASSSSVMPPIPIPVPAPPVTTLTPWSTSEVTPPRYMDSPLWSYDCLACRKLYTGPTAAAERTAGLILAASLLHLKKIEWASFFESRANNNNNHDEDACGQTDFQRGTGTHEWRVLRDSCGAVVDVERVFY